MVDMALALGAKNKTRVEQEMRDVIKFETQLANVSQATEIRGRSDASVDLQLSLPMEKRRNFTTLYNKMKLSKVMELAPTVRLLLDSESRIHKTFCGHID